MLGSQNLNHDDKITSAMYVFLLENALLNGGCCFFQKKRTSTVGRS